MFLLGHRFKFRTYIHTHTFLFGYSHNSTSLNFHINGNSVQKLCETIIAGKAVQVNGNIKMKHHKQ